MLEGLIPVCVDQNPLVQVLVPMDMVAHGCSMSLFQASALRSTISSKDLKTRLESQLSQMNCQTFSTGFSSGERGGRGRAVWPVPIRGLEEDDVEHYAAVAAIGSAATTPASSRTVKLSSPSISSGSVPLCSFMPRTILRGTPMPMCSR